QHGQDKEPSQQREHATGEAPPPCRCGRFGCRHGKVSAIAGAGTIIHSRVSHDQCTNGCFSVWSARRALAARYAALEGDRCTPVGTTSVTVMPSRRSCLILSGLLVSRPTRSAFRARSICAATV